ncbi:MAG TPA: hypothetical protein PL033_19330 [Candidatus Brocadiia bacterium]|nr:hypothetical protein [Candidatus Brocadiia bacterium]
MSDITGNRLTPVFAVILGTMATGCAIGGSGPRVEISGNAERIGMGRTLEVSAAVKVSEGQSAAGYLLLPYVDGKRWGAHEFTNAEGRATFLIPLPNPGEHEIVVMAKDPVEPPSEKWIWSSDLRDNQKVYLQRVFTLAEEPTSAELWIAIDDQADAWVNGKTTRLFGGWQGATPYAVPQGVLRKGENVISVEGRNGTGPAALLARLDTVGAAGKVSIVTDGEWRVYNEQPANWPAKAEAEGTLAKQVGTLELGGSVYAVDKWPTLHDGSQFFTGAALPEGARTSNKIAVTVEKRKLCAIKTDPDHLVGVQWEPWFTPKACWWQTAHAVPLMGFYRSDDPSVIRQHMIWLIESGTDYLIADWTNHIWGCEHWADRPAGSQEIVDATTAALNVLAEMRDEGHPVPKMVLYPGLNNGPATTMVAVNEELDWIYENYVKNPKYAGLFVEYLGKPLVIIHNGGGPGWIAANAKGVPVNEEHFTVRWHSSQNQMCKFHEQGYWSWMDGSFEPCVTYYKGRPECLTVSTAFFADGGWLRDTACGRRNGWTYIESMKAALRYRPRFIELHQFNEFAGQPEGQGYGEKHDVYVDSYSVELSDDFEPVSLTTPAYRGNGGWGFFYLNLTRALVDIYRQDTPETTVVAVSKPNMLEAEKGDLLKVVWTWAGKAPAGMDIAIDGKVVTENAPGKTATVSLSGVSNGRHVLRLTARGTKSRYRLSYTEDSLPLEKMEEAWVEVGFVVEGK